MVFEFSNGAGSWVLWVSDGWSASYEVEVSDKMQSQRIACVLVVSVELDLLILANGAKVLGSLVSEEQTY